MLRGTPVISFRAFSKRYGTHRAVESVDLEIGPGEVVALLGPNGSGKTTCLKAAAGLIAPTSGEVRLGGRPSGDPAAREVLSFLPQRVSFPDALSGREVLEFYRSLRGVAAARVDAVLKFAALNGSGSRAVGQYSGGMVQRLGLAVAMLPDTPVILLDEPTAALDPDGLCTFYGLVGRRRSEGKTVLFTSHHLGDVERLADRFAVLVGGRLVATARCPRAAGPPVRARRDAAAPGPQAARPAGEGPGDLPPGRLGGGRSCRTGGRIAPAVRPGRGAEAPGPRSAA